MGAGNATGTIGLIKLRPMSKNQAPMSCIAVNAHPSTVYHDNYPLRGADNKNCSTNMILGGREDIFRYFCDEFRG